MNLDQLITAHEAITRSKVLLAAREIGRLGEIIWPVLQDDKLVFVSLGQNQKVLMHQVLDQTVTSYSFEILFEISGWGVQPHLSSERIAMLLGRNLWIDPVLKEAVVSNLKGKGLAQQSGRRRPVHLRARSDVEKLKDYLGGILLSLWFERHLYSFPADMSEVLSIVEVPLDIQACLAIVESSSGTLSEIDNQFIVQAILHYHTVNDGLWEARGVDIDREEYNLLRDRLYGAWRRRE